MGLLIFPSVRYISKFGVVSDIPEIQEYFHCRHRYVSTYVDIGNLSFSVQVHCVVRTIIA